MLGVSTATLAIANLVYELYDLIPEEIALDQSGT
jgi:hypothetical protein